MLADIKSPAVQELSTRSGKLLRLRPVNLDDEPLLAEFFDRVSDDDRRFRFLSSHGHLNHQQLAPMVEVDHYRAESFIAFDKATEIVVGHALLVCDKAMDTGEIAISVCSKWRGQGVGWALIDVVSEAARQRGVRRVISIENRENRAAIDLEREKGFKLHPVDGDPTLVMLEKLLR